MESRVEGLERSLKEWRIESQTQLNELKRLLKGKSREYTRGRSRRRHTHHRFTNEESHGSRASGSFKPEYRDEEEEPKSVEAEFERPRLLAVEEPEPKSSRLNTDMQRNHMRGKLEFAEEKEAAEAENRVIPVIAEEEEKKRERADTSLRPTNVTGREVSDDWFQEIGGGRRSCGDDRCVGGSSVSKGDDGRYEGGGRDREEMTMVDGERIPPSKPSELPEPSEPHASMAEVGLSLGMDEPPLPLAAETQGRKEKRIKEGTWMELQKLVHLSDLMGQAQTTMGMEYQQNKDCFIAQGCILLRVNGFVEEIWSEYGPAVTIYPNILGLQQQNYFGSTTVMIVRIGSSWLVKSNSGPFDFAPVGVEKLYLEVPGEKLMGFTPTFDVIVLSSAIGLLSIMHIA